VLRVGVCTRDQFARLGENPSSATSEISYDLLDVPDDAVEEEIRMFEAITLSLRTSNGTMRTTLSHRFQDVDRITCQVLRRFFDKAGDVHIQDRAVSHGLTSCEWAQSLFEVFPHARVEASDRMLFLYRIAFPSGEKFILEPDGHPLQYIRPPFVVRLSHREPLRFPLNHVLVAHAKWRLKRLALPVPLGDRCADERYEIDRISCIHPRARLLSKTDARFRMRTRSVFEQTPGVDVLRTMNILNKVYFSTAQLIEGANATFQSLRIGGIWIVGRTFEEDLSNHVTIFRRHKEGWEILERVGRGSEMEDFARQAPGSVAGQVR